MASDGFRDCTLDDLAEFRNGKALSTDRYSPFGKHPVFGSNGQIARSDDVLHPNSVIVIGRVGAYCGSVHRVDEPSWVTDNAIVATAKENVDLRFLYYRLNSLDLRRTAIGSAQPLMTQGGIKIIPTTVPPFAEQRAIANILGVLDDKIELNRRMNETLEGLARAIFQSWFVDFDPVRAQRDGLPPPALSPTTAALFPDSFEDSELGKIPKGWKVQRVADIGAVICGKTPSTQVADYYCDDVPFITIPDMHGNVFATTTQKRLSHAGAASQKNKTFPAGAICVSCIATPGLVVIASEPSQSNQQINTVVPFGQEETYFWFWTLRDLGAEIRAGGSGGSVLMNLSTGRFAELRVLSPPEELRSRYHRLVAPLFEGIQANERESMTLAAIRDALLPKLLSGEIRVAEAERLVEETK